MDVIQSELPYITAMLRSLSNRLDHKQLTSIETAAEIHRLAERLQAVIVHLSWHSPNEPPEVPLGVTVHPGLSIPVLMVIQDPRVCGPGDLPFVDIGAYWPATHRWTLTCAVVRESQRFADDYLVNVLGWLPLNLFPTPVSSKKRDMELFR